jgi:hypothetical protein
MVIRFADCWFRAALCLACFGWAVSAAAEDWRLVEDGDDEAYFIDLDTLRRTRSEVHVWLWTIMNYNSRDGDNSKEFLKVDCREMSYVALQSTFFRKDRSRSSSYNSNRSYAIPGSIMETVLIGICDPRGLGRRWEDPYEEQIAKWLKSEQEAEDHEEKGQVRYPQIPSLPDVFFAKY